MMLGTCRLAVADPGEGLDLEGDLVYAVNVRGPTTQVGSVSFVNEFEQPGVILNSQYDIEAWEARPDYGPGEADQGLAQVMHSIRWSPAGVARVRRRRRATRHGRRR